MICDRRLNLDLIAMICLVDLRAEDHHQDIRDAHRYLSMRHNGADCSQISKAQYNTCNAEYVDYAAGNSCAQVLSKSHRIGWSTGKALDIAESAPNQPVHFRASLAPSLQNWWAGIVGTCATVSLFALFCASMLLRVS